MPGKTFLPSSDTKLLLWASAFSSQISASAGEFGVDAASAARLASAVSGYSSALAIATNESTRTKGAVAYKNDQRQLLRQQAHAAATLVQAHPAIKSEQLSDLALTVHKTTHTIRTAPMLAPLIKNLSVIGRSATFLISDAAHPNARPRRANNAKGATILSYVGANPPPVGDIGWKLQMQSTKTRFTVQFADDVSPAEPCWVSAVWYTARGEYSPISTPLQIYLQGSAAAAASAQADQSREADELKQAA